MPIAAEAKRVQKAHFHAHGTTLAGLMRDASGRSARVPRGRPRNPARPGRAGRSAGGRARPPAGPQADLHQCRRALCPPSARCAGCRRTFRRAARHSRRRASAQARRHGYELLLDRFGIDPARAAMVEDMAQNLKPAKTAGDDHRMGRQWLGTRQSRATTPTLSTSPSPTSANGLRKCLETKNDRPAATDHRGRLG